MRAGTPIAGYASLFWREDLAGDVVAAGAFAASLKARPPSAVGMFFQHETGSPVGRWHEVAEDAAGLFVRGQIEGASPEARLAAGLVLSGAVDGLSIGFNVRRSTPDRTGRLRVLTEIELIEVSIVAFPLLPAARLRVAAPPLSA